MVHFQTPTPQTSSTAISREASNQLHTCLSNTRGCSPAGVTHMTLKTLPVSHTWRWDPRGTLPDPAATEQVRTRMPPAEIVRDTQEPQAGFPLKRTSHGNVPCTQPGTNSTKMKDKRRDTKHQATWRNVTGPKTCYVWESCPSQNKRWSETQKQIQTLDGNKGGKSMTKPISSPPVIANFVCTFSKSFQTAVSECWLDARHSSLWGPGRRTGDDLSLRKPLSTHLALLIQQIQNSHFGLNEVDAWLIVIEINQGPRYLFLHIFFLFQLKDMLQGKKKTVFCEIKRRINTSHSHLKSSWHRNPGCQVVH